MRSRILGSAVGLLVAGAVVLVGGVASAASDPCGAGSNPIVCENSQPGSPIPSWYTEDSWGDIQGFPTSMSVQPGQTINFKVTSPKAFTVSVYRMGYYGGDGARLMPTSPTGTFPAKNQSPCLHDGTTGLVDCGNWTSNLSWAVPSNAVSGIYFMMLDIPDGSGFMPVPFVVRNDSSHSDILVQTSDQTWQAYNLSAARTSTTVAVRPRTVGPTR